MRIIDSLTQGFSVGSGAGAGPQAFLNAEERGATAPNGKPSLTIAQAGFHLIGGEPGWSSALGTSAVVSYGYRSTAPTTMPDDTGGFTRFNAAQITQSERALLAWSDVAAITFVRVGSGASGEQAYSNSASILFANYATGVEGAAAFGNYPGDASFASASGDVWVNSTLSYNTRPTANNYGGLVLVHEIGHAIGLAHPGDYDAGDGVTITYAKQAEYFEDSLQYTVMSYFDETNTGANFMGAYSASPLLDDISAAQQEYGANLTTRTGNTVYGFNSTADRPWFAATGGGSALIFAVWDAGGVDTFDFSGFAQGQTIDLQAGHFSSVGGLVGNVAVGSNVGIENAIGGSGIDTIYGNALTNQLEGRLGADLLYGLDGADVLNGGAGDDRLEGGAGDDWLDGGSGLDILIGGSGNDVYVVGDGQDAMQELAGNGTDTVLVQFSYELLANFEVAKADAGFDVNLFGRNDQGDNLIGNERANYLGGLAGNDNLLGGAGNDSLDGGAGVDWLDGGDGDDVVYGGADDDGLAGGAGADWLDGASGADNMYGGAGDDTYLVDSTFDQVIEEIAAGIDTVMSAIDFQLHGNIEILRLAGAAANGFGSEDGERLYGGAGANYLGGLGGADFIYAGAGNDAVDGGAGNDWLDGEAGDDTMAGSAGSDGLQGGTGNDWLDGGAGLDVLYGGMGNDTLIGGADHDQFMFQPGDGADRILDFMAGGGEDAINLQAYVAVGVTWSIGQFEADTVITMTNGDSILLAGVQAGDLNPQDGWIF
jgi:serralysin